MTDKYYSLVDRAADKLTRCVLDNSVSVIIISIVISLLIASGGRHLVFSNDYRIFFSDKNPELQAFEQLQNTYTKNDNILFVVESSDGDVFNKKTLMEVSEITNKAWKIPYAIRVDSLTNFQNTYSNDDELIVEDLFSGIEHLSNEEIKKRKTIALKEPLLLDNLIVKSGKATAINVTLSYPQLSEREVPESVETARSIKEEFQQKVPENKIYLTGVSMLNNAFSEAGFGDLSTLIPLMYIIIMVLTALVLRSFSAILIPLAIVTLSTLVAMGLAGFSGIQLSPISGSAPIIILTIGIADSVHLLITMRKKMYSGSDKITAIEDSIRINMLPVVITSVTTIVGFLALNFSDSPPYWHLGNITSIGVAVACINSIILLPALVKYLPLRSWERKNSDSHSYILNKVANTVIKKPKTIFIISIVLCAGLIQYIPQLSLNDQWTKYFDKTIRFRSETDSSLKYFGLYPIEFSINAGKAEGINSPEYLKQVSEFVDYLRRQPYVKHVYSITDVLKRINKNMNNDNNDLYRIPSNRKLAAQYLLFYEMSLPYGLDVNDRINVDKSATRVTVILENVTTSQTKQFLTSTQKWMEHNFQSSIVEVKPTSAQVMFTYIADRNVRNMIVGTIVAIFGISIVMILSLGNLKLGLISLLPNALPILVTFGAWSLIVGEVGFSVATVASISLGVVVDYSVHFLSKYVRARKEQNYDIAQSIHYAFQNVGLAITVNTLILATGFCLLTMSTFKINSDMGLLTAMAIVFAQILDFLLLPAFLLVIAKFQRATA